MLFEHVPHNGTATLVALFWEKILFFIYTLTTWKMSEDLIWWQGIGSKNTIDHLKPCPRKLKEMKKSSLILLWPYNIGLLLHCDEANHRNVHPHIKIYVLLLKKQLIKHIQMAKTYAFLKMKKNVCKLKGHSRCLTIPILKTSISVMISIIIKVLTECLLALTTWNTFFFHVKCSKQLLGGSIIMPILQMSNWEK